MLKGTETEKNLLAAFAGESQAHVKYKYFEQQAKKDGFEKVSDIFCETAANEKAHAEIWFKLLNNGNIGLTMENLKSASEGEHYEWSEMYKGFAETARKEGFDNIACQFDDVATIEKEHEKRYLELANQISNNEMFKKNEKTTWICSNCGHRHTGDEAPHICRVCSYPQAYFVETAE